MSVINKNIVLKLNKNWQAIGISTVAKAIVDLSAGVSAMALDFEYDMDENGNYILDENGYPVGNPWPTPVDWEKWITLPVRSWEMEDAIHYGSEGQKLMRAPTVLIAKKYGKMPKKSFVGKNPSKDAIIIRDGLVDQYTGKKLRRDEATIDHVLPRSRGGKDEWTNLVTTSKDINSRKGNKLNPEAGLKLIREPVAPKEITADQLIRDIKHPTWKQHLPHLVET